MATRDAEGFRIVDKYKTYNNDGLQTIEPGDAGQEIISIGLEALKAGRSAKDYPCNDAGLRRFKQRTAEYFERVRNFNEDKEGTKKMMLDIEGLCVYAGINRMTLLNWENNRPEEWRNYIKSCKEIVTAAKKARGASFQIPPALLIFDLKNNSGYSDTTEINITATDGRTKQEIIEDELANSGLVWDPIAGDYRPAEALPDNGEEVE